MNGRQLHVNRALQNVAIKYRPQNQIADMIFPIVPVDHQADAYNIWSLAEAFRISDSRRSPGTEANKVKFNATSDTFYCKNRALKTDLPIEDIENADPAYLQEMRVNRVQRLMDDHSLGWEQRIANQLTSGSNVGSYSGVASNWSSTGTGLSNPYGDVTTAMDIVHDTTGYRPNFVIMGGLAWRNFKQHADVIDLIHGTTGNAPNRLVTRALAASLFEVDDVMVGEAHYNSADWDQSASLSMLWGANVLVGYRAPRPSIEEPSLGYAFRWRKGRIANMRPEVHPYDNKTKSEEVEVGYYQDEKITASALGYLITDVNSSV